MLVTRTYINILFLKPQSGFKHSTTLYSRLIYSFKIATSLMKLQLILSSIHERYLFYCSPPGDSVFTATIHFKNMCSISSVTLNESSDSRIRKSLAVLMPYRLRYTEFAPSQRNPLRSFFIKLTFSSKFSKGLSSEVCKQVLLFCPTFLSSLPHCCNQSKFAG
jgi:hypothetical protein